MLERILGYWGKGEAGCLFRKDELKIEHCHSTVAWALQALGFVLLFLSLHSCESGSFSSVIKEAGCVLSRQARTQPL